MKNSSKKIRSKALESSKLIQLPDECKPPEQTRTAQLERYLVSSGLFFDRNSYLKNAKITFNTRDGASCQD
jgi:hypothetical protein